MPLHTEIEPDRVFALREAASRAAERFASLRQSASGGVWDAIVLTAANASQAAAYRSELDLRRQLDLLPADCDLIVLPDPPPPRVGSGGATLLALEALARSWIGRGDAERLTDLFARHRALVIHSGGDSQRAPFYGAIGKIFTPLPVALPESPLSAIFDWLYLLVSGIPALPGEIIVVSGDVVLIFDPSRLGERRADVRGVGVAAPIETATRHGVFATGPEGRLRRFLHKQDAHVLVSAGVVDPTGCAPIDSGIVVFGLPAIGRLLRLAGLEMASGAAQRTGAGILDAASPGSTPFDLYDDWMPALGDEQTRADYDAGRGLSTDRARVRSAVWEATRGLSAEAVVPETAAFVHLGTHREYHDSIARPSVLRTVFPLASVRESKVQTTANHNGAIIASSSLGDDVELGAGAVVDHCRVAGRLLAGPDTVLSGLDLPAGLSLRVPPASVCYQTRVRDGGSRTVTVLLGLDDNPKADYGDPKATFQGLLWADWLTARGLAPGDVWPADTPRTLWEAVLFVDSESDPDLTVLEWLANADPAPEPRRRWLRARRYSLRECLLRADVTAILDWRAALREEIAVGRVLDDISMRGDDEFRDLFATLPPVSRRRVFARLSDAVDRQEDLLGRARLLALLARLGSPDQVARHAGGPDQRELEDRAIAAVRESIVSAPVERRQRPAGVEPGSGVAVRMPVRIDLGGGWTDTPPFSLERGGAVVNAALAFGGRLPIEAAVEALVEPRLLIRDDDLGYETEIRDPAELRDLGNVFDPFLLQKASLVLTGILAPSDEPIDRQLARLGGGLRLRTSSRLPRGSGLGTSSIVGAALLRALDEITGQPVDDSGLSQQTLALEQLMTTGGGWQDQMGAIAPGLKLVTTEPGIRQSPRVHPVAWTPEQVAEFEARLIVGYTGHHRVARNILREVVLAYLGRDAVAMQALYQLRALAQQIYHVANRFDLELLGTLVNQAWLLNKSLDPNTSYPALEGLFRAFAPHVHGVKLVGAGGGGFFFAIGKSPESRGVVAELLARDREFARGYLVEATLSGGGRLEAR